MTTLEFLMARALCFLIPKQIHPRYNSIPPGTDIRLWLNTKYILKMDTGGFPIATSILPKGIQAFLAYSTSPLRRGWEIESKPRELCDLFGEKSCETEFLVWVKLSMCLCCFWLIIQEYCEQELSLTVHLYGSFWFTWNRPSRIWKRAIRRNVA